MSEPERIGKRLRERETTTTTKCVANFHSGHPLQIDTWTKHCSNRCLCSLETTCHTKTAFWPRAFVDFCRQPDKKSVNAIYMHVTTVPTFQPKSANMKTAIIGMGEWQREAPKI